jgi:hypothetical protein
MGDSPAKAAPYDVHTPLHRVFWSLFCDADSLGRAHLVIFQGLAHTKRYRHHIATPGRLSIAVVPTPPRAQVATAGPWIAICVGGDGSITCRIAARRLTLRRVSKVTPLPRLDGILISQMR